MQVGVVLMVDLATGDTVATASLLMADDRAGQRHGHEPFADPFGPRKEVGVSESPVGQGPPEDVLLPFMAENLVECHADFLFARNWSTAAMIRSLTCSTVPRASIM